MHRLRGLSQSSPVSFPFTWMLQSATLRWKSRGTPPRLRDAAALPFEISALVEHFLRRDGRNVSMSPSAGARAAKLPLPRQRDRYRYACDNPGETLLAANQESGYFHASLRCFHAVRALING